MILKRGSKGLRVILVQKMLNVMADGNFGPLTEEAVKEFQKANGLVADGIVGDKTWAVLESKETMVKRSKRFINEIIVHCTATPEGKDYTVDTIKLWHQKRGFSDIGYHYIVHLDGRVERGRHEDIAGAHCVGHNTHSIAVCYVGGLASDNKTPKDTRTEAQKTAIRNLLMQLLKLYDKATIHGHRDFAAKACPSFDATAEYKDLRSNLS